jgi:hypothetical protein
MQGICLFQYYPVRLTTHSRISLQNNLTSICLAGKIKAPLRPAVAFDGDISNFEDYRAQVRVGRADVKENDAWWTEGTSEVVASTEIDLKKEFQGF